MKTKSQAVHIERTRRVYKDKVYETVLLRRSYRKDGKVMKETVGNLSDLPPSLIHAISEGLKGKPITVGEPSSLPIVTRSLPHGAVAAVTGTMKTLSFDDILGRGMDPEVKKAIGTLVALRILSPGSKLSGARHVALATAQSTLGEELETGDWSDDRLYRAMDVLLAHKEKIERRLAKKHLHEGDLVLYDLSSSYMTGTKCSLTAYGHNRDGKKRYPQIVYGLLCTREGCPVSVEVFRGNTSDPASFETAIETVLKKWGLSRVIFVGDRGMITQTRITDLRKFPGADWITALRSVSIAKLVREGRLPPSLFQENNLAEITSPDFPGERLVACWNARLAREREHHREALLRATEKSLAGVKNSCERKNQPMTEKEKIVAAVTRALEKHHVGKHFLAEYTGTSFTFARNAERIETERKLDGIYVIRTSVPEESMNAFEAVRAYKDLTQVEQAFRSLKTVDLKLRPVFHYREDRVRAHVFLCMLAYYVEWHMRRSLAPILFDEEDADGARSAREDIVDKAQPSPATQEKTRKKKTVDGFPLMNFQDLLRHLATLTKNTLSFEEDPEGKERVFERLSVPTPLQRKAFGLLEIKGM